MFHMHLAVKSIVALKSINRCFYNGRRLCFLRVRTDPYVKRTIRQMIRFILYRIVTSVTNLTVLLLTIVPET